MRDAETSSRWKLGSLETGGSPEIHLEFVFRRPGFETRRQNCHRNVCCKKEETKVKKIQQGSTLNNRTGERSPIELKFTFVLKDYTKLYIIHNNYTLYQIIIQKIMQN